MASGTGTVVVMIMVGGMKWGRVKVSLGSVRSGKMVIASWIEKSILVLGV